MNPYNPNELYHHGINGMKWGKRNGPPYPLALKDHSAAEKRAMKNEQYGKKAKTVRYKEVDSNKKNDQNESNGVDLRAAKQLSDETIKATKGVAKIIDKAARKKDSERIDTSHLSNKEMLDYITRANLEKKYASLKAEEYAAGRRQATEFLDTFGDILTTAGSVLSAIVLAKAIAKEVKK